MNSIHRATRIQFTPRTRVDVLWDADDKGFVISSIQVTAYAQVKKGVTKLKASFITDNLNFEKMETIIGDIQSQIAGYNKRFGRSIDDLPKLTKITGRAILPQGF